jgi:hypothetical protein
VRAFANVPGRGQRAPQLPDRRRVRRLGRPQEPVIAHLPPVHHDAHTLLGTRAHGAGSGGQACTHPGTVKERAEAGGVGVAELLRPDPGLRRSLLYLKPCPPAARQPENSEAVAPE